MLVNQLTLTACGLLLAGVQARPNPVAAPAPAETLRLPDGSIIILGDPKSSTHIGKRDPDINPIGNPSTGIIWDKPETVPIQIDPKEKRDPQISIGQPTGGIIWDTPETVPIQIEPKEKRDPQIFPIKPTGGIIWDEPVTVPIQIDPKEKRDPQIFPIKPTGGIVWGKRDPQVSGTITWETAAPATTASISWETGIATSQASITWDTAGPTAGASTTGTPTTSSKAGQTSAPGAPPISGCGCADDAAPGNYCGYCSQITGSWVSWNAYQCSQDGSCKNLGFNRGCVNGSPKQCPSVIIS